MRKPVEGPFKNRLSVWQHKVFLAESCDEDNIDEDNIGLSTGEAEIPLQCL